MPTVKVRNIKNEEVGELELSDAVFGAPLNEGLIHAAVRNFMANARQGTSATKTRGDVSGAGRMAFFLTEDLDLLTAGGWTAGVAGPASSYSDFGWYPLTDLPANMIDRARVAVRNYASGARFSTYPAFGM